MPGRSVAIAVALACCLAAIIGVPVGGARTPTATLHLVDFSRSCGIDPGRLADALAARMLPGHPDDRVAVIGFRDVATLLAPWAPADEADAAVSAMRSGLSRLSPNAGGSSVVSGLKLARGLLAELPTHRGRIVLWGDLRHDPDQLARERTVTPELVYGGRLRDPDPDLRLGVSGSPRLMPGTRGTVELVVSAAGGRRRVARLDAFGQVHRVPVTPGRSESIVVTVDVPSDGTSLTARLAPDAIGNPWPGNDRLTFPVGRGDARSVGVLGAWPASITVPPSIELRPLERAGAGELDRLDAVVMVNVAIDASWDREWTAPLGRAIVDRGLGLLVLGGTDGFRAGGYGGSKLDPELPLSSRPPRGRDVHVLIDRSGSMERDDRLGRAVESLRLLAAGLHEDDRIQVWPFGAVPLAPIALSPMAPEIFLERALPAVWKLVPAGGTRLAGAFEGPARAALEVARDRDPVLVVLSDLKDDALDGAATATIKKQLLAFRGGALALLLDPTPETTARSVGLGMQVRPVRELLPQIMLHAVEGAGWQAFEPVSARWRVQLPGTPKAGTLRGLNPVVPGERARILLETSDGRPLLGDVRRGAGRIIALATDANTEGWLRGCVGPLLEAVLPRTAIPVRATVTATGLRLELATDVTGPLTVAWEGAAPTPLREVAPGVWRTAAIPPHGAGRVLRGDGSPLARFLAPRRDDPEFLREPAPWTAAAAAAGTAPTVPPPLRWPFGVVALAVMSACVIWPPRDR